MSEATFSSEITVSPIAEYGGDWLICDAARVSTAGAVGSGPRTPTKSDCALIRTLVAQRHGAPFQHGGITFFVEAPIFVVREWRTHRVYMHQATDDFSYSEASARYRPLSGKFWLPSAARPMMKPIGHKPMRPEYDIAGPEMAESVRWNMKRAYDFQWKIYEMLITADVAPEVARAVIGTGAYSAMYVSTNPRSLSHFLSLRTHDEAAATRSYPQLEIEEAARSAERIFAEGWPMTYAAWNENGRQSL